jgi:cytoskeletal protein RodZ
LHLRIKTLILIPQKDIKYKDMERKYNKRKSTKKRYVVVAIAAAFIAVTDFSSAQAFNLWPFQKQTIQNSDSSPSPKPNHPSPKNNATTTKGDTQSPIDPGKTADQVPISSAMAATITTLEETGQQIQFAASVTNSPTAGVCVVTFSNPNDRPVTQQVNATVSNSTASCGPLNVPASEFSYLGTWQVTFHYYLGSQQATSQGTITIR